MKKICEETQMLILSGGKLAPASLKHLEECVDCRTFHSLQERIAGLPVQEEEPSALLDDRIRKKAAQRISSRRWMVWKIALPIAASILFCCAMLIRLDTSGPAASLSPHTQQVLKQVNSEHSREFEDNLLSMSCDFGNGIHAISDSFDLMI